MHTQRSQFSGVMRFSSVFLKLSFGSLRCSASRVERCVATSGPDCVRFPSREACRTFRRCGLASSLMDIIIFVRRDSSVHMSYLVSDSDSPCEACSGTDVLVLSIDAWIVYKLIASPLQSPRRCQDGLFRCTCRRHRRRSRIASDQRVTTNKS